MNLVNRLLPPFPETVALMAGGRPLTYAQLDSASQRWRGGLAEAGVEPGDRVVVIAGNEVLLVLAELAILGAGAVMAPLNPQSPPTELDQELVAVAPTAILVGVGGEAAWAGLVAEHPRWADLRLDHGTWTDRARGEPVDGASTRGRDNGRSSDPRSGPPPLPVLEVDPDTPAALLFTSGTAGMPKPAILTHGNLDTSLRAMHALPVELTGAGHVGLAVIPMFHIFGLHALVNLGLSIGATVVMEDYRSPDQVVDLVRSHEVTILSGPPNLWQALAAHPGIGGDDFASVRLAVSGAAKLPPGIWQAVHDRLGLDVAEGYGLTETCAVVATAVGRPGPVGSVGRLLAGVEARLVDDRGADVLVGDPGEIWVRGPMVSPGYFRSNGEPDPGPDADGWLHTGDVGIVDDDGNLAIVDRSKDLVIVSGFNVYPGEVEQVLIGHPDVAAAAVVGRPDPITGEVVVAHVVLSPGSRPDPDTLVAHCRTHLARYKVPRRIEVRSELPQGLGGKVRRQELR